MKSIIRKATRRTAWLKCPECEREVGVAAGSVFRGKGDNTAYCVDARRPIMCPWCSKPDSAVYLHIAKGAKS